MKTSLIFIFGRFALSLQARSIAHLPSQHGVGNGRVTQIGGHVDGKAARSVVGSHAAGTFQGTHGSKPSGGISVGNGKREDGYGRVPKGGGSGVGNWVSTSMATEGGGGGGVSGGGRIKTGSASEGNNGSGVRKEKQATARTVRR